MTFDFVGEGRGNWNPKTIDQKKANPGGGGGVGLKVLRYIMDREVRMRSSFQIREDWTKKVPSSPRKIPNKSLSKSFHPKTDHPNIYKAMSLQCPISNLGKVSAIPCHWCTWELHRPWDFETTRCHRFKLGITVAKRQPRPQGLCDSETRDSCRLRGPETRLSIFTANWADSNGNVKCAYGRGQWQIADGGKPFFKFIFDRALFSFHLVNYSATKRGLKQHKRNKGRFIKDSTGLRS